MGSGRPPRPGTVGLIGGGSARAAYLRTLTARRTRPRRSRPSRAAARGVGVSRGPARTWSQMPRRCRCRR
jgi:hypothetical protein